MVEMSLSESGWIQLELPFHSSNTISPSRQMMSDSCAKPAKDPKEPLAFQSSTLYLII